MISEYIDETYEVSVIEETYINSKMNKLMIQDIQTRWIKQRYDVIIERG